MTTLLSLLALVLLLLGRASAWKPARPAASAQLQQAARACLAGLLLGTQPVGAVVDCNSDCVKNCLLAAPGSADYCKASCKDYCDDDSREDGLSGSKGSSRGETGIFGGGGAELISGTPTRDLPPKTPFNFIDPALSTKYGASASRIDSNSRHK